MACVVLVLAFAVWDVAVAASGAEAQIAPQPSGGGAVVEATDPVPEQYIVTLRADDSKSSSSVAATADAVAERHGAEVLDVYDAALDGFTAHMSATEASELAGDPEVLAVEQDGFVYASATQSPQSLSYSAVPPDSWGLDRIDQAALPLDGYYSYASTASTVHAYVVDSGIHVSDDFGGRVQFGVDEVSPSLNGDDCDGHGTHVAGTLGGSRYGVAKGVTLVSVRVLDCTGRGTFSDVIKGVDWITANAIRPAVANMSLAGGATSDALDLSIRNSIASGIVYVVAAGNNHGDACASSPGKIPEVLTVGATDSRDTLASFSNFGPCVDLFAPGDRITSDWFSSTTATHELSGTSMSSPHVAGVAALVLAGAPCASAEDVSSAIVSHATAGVLFGLDGTTENRLLNSSFVSPPFATPRPPCAPALSAVSGQDGVHLSWYAPPEQGSPISGYKIYRSGALIATLGSAAREFVDNSFVAGQSYTYRLEAGSALGATPSPEVTPAPSSPTLTGLRIGGTVRLTWTPSFVGGGAPLIGYRVLRSTTPSHEDPATPLVELPPNTTSFDDNSAALDTIHYYRVVAVSSALTMSALSNEISARPSLAPRAISGAAPLTSAATLTEPTTAASEGDTLTRVVRALDGSVLVHERPNGTTGSWGSLGGVVTSDPVMVATAGGLVVFARGVFGDLYWRRHVGNAWQPWQSGGGYLSSRPAVAVDSVGAWVFVRGGDNRLYFGRLDNNGNWSGWSTGGGYLSSEPVAASDSAGTSVFVRGGDYGLYAGRIRSNGVWAGWRGLGGFLSSDLGVAADNAAIEVFVRGGDGGLYHGRVSSTDVWSGWRSLGGYVNSDPVPISTGDGVVVFLRGGDWGLYFGRVESSSGAWSGYRSGGGLLTTNVAGTALNGEVHVAVRGGDSLAYAGTLSTAGVWSGWQPLLG